MNMTPEEDAWLSEKIQQGIDLAVENQDLIKEKMKEIYENQSGRN